MFAIADLEQMFRKILLIKHMIDLFCYSFVSWLRQLKNALCVQQGHRWLRMWGIHPRAPIPPSIPYGHVLRYKSEQHPKQMAFKHSEKEVFDEQNEPSGEVTFIYSM